MPTVRERILAHLRQRPEGIDDDLLTIEIGLSRRQHTNMVCNRLAREGLVDRRSVGGKIRNFLTGSPDVVHVDHQRRSMALESDAPWH